MTPNKSLLPTRAVSAACHLKENIIISNNTSYFIKYSVIIWAINYRYGRGLAIHNKTFIFVMIDKLAHLKKTLLESAFSWKFCYIYFRWMIHSATVPELYLHFYWYVCVSYNSVCSEIFVHLITVSILLCLFMFYNIIVCCTSSWDFFHMNPLCMSYSSTVFLLNSHFY